MQNLTAVLPDIHKMNKTYTKVALFGGVYNNHLSLKAAIQIAKDRAADGLFCLGDLGGFGPSPNKVFPLLKENGVICIQGNYEESLINRIDDCGCGYTHPRDNHFAQISYDYTNERLSDENRAYLKTFPKQIQFKLGEKTVHLCHGSPRRINEFLWESATSTGFLNAMTRDLESDALCFTHSGIKWKRNLEKDKLAVNVGVLGRPENSGEKNVWFAELTVFDGKLAVEFVPVPYDFDALAREMEEEKLPGEFVETIRTGWWTTCMEIMPGKEREKGKY